MTATLTLPADPTLVVLCGASGVGKSTWAKRFFPATAIVSSDACRAVISDDENDQNATGDAFALVNFIISRRLAYGKTTVVDSTALRARDRRQLVSLARDAGVPAILVVFDGDLELAKEGQQLRAAEGGRVVPEHALEKMDVLVRGTLDRVASGAVIDEEGFTAVHVYDRAGADAIVSVGVANEDDLVNVDVLGDVHGCLSQLEKMLAKLGYVDDGNGVPIHPDGRVVVFVGDLVDRGPDSLGVLRLVAAMVAAGSARMGALGNHDWKNFRKFVLGSNVQLTHGLEETVRQVKDPAVQAEYTELCRTLFAQAPASSVYDNGRLAVGHGAVLYGSQGQKPRRGRKSHAATLSLYGQTDGTTVDGFPNRIYDWAEDWKGSDTLVVFGHDVTGDDVRYINDNVVGIDTGCAFGGPLTALRWPSREIVQVR